MGKSWRIILDGPKDAYYNMAKDETLLLSYKNNRIPVFRIYSWAKPSVSLGYRQKAKDVLNIDACRKLEITFVRRITGGGAILHHREITYSIVCGPDDLALPRNVKSSYKALNSFLIDFYRSLGFKASFACDIYKNIQSDPADFCFSGFEPFDILIDGKKAGGNAQRRSKRVIFQHGSIPFYIDWKTVSCLFKDTRRLETKGILPNEFIQHKDSFRVLQKKLMDSFVKTFDISFEVTLTNKKEDDILKKLIFSKYSQDTWNMNNDKSKLAQ